jgi:hypothetical protein
LDPYVEGYGVREFARRAGMSRQWLHMLCKQGRGPRVINVFAPDKRGRVSTRRGRVVIPKAGGDQWIAIYRRKRSSE